MSTSMMLLSMLERSPAHGYTLKQAFDDELAPPRPLGFGQVYASLARFERAGWVEVVEVARGDGPDRKRYRITPDGVERLESWVYAPDLPGRPGASSLCARLTVALLSGRAADRVLEAQRDQHLGRMRDLQQMRRTATGADLLALTYELAHLDADLRWIDESENRLGGGMDARRPDAS